MAKILQFLKVPQPTITEHMGLVYVRDKGVSTCAYTLTLVEA